MLTFEYTFDNHESKRIMLFISQLYT